MFRLLAVALLMVVLAECSGEECSFPTNPTVVNLLAYNVCLLNKKVKKLEEAGYVRSTDVDRKIQSKLSGFARDWEITGIKSRLSSPGVSCYNKYTGWTGRSDARIMNLDRHNLDCPKPYFLARFQLKRSGYENHSNVRYEYRCCKVVI